LAKSLIHVFATLIVLHSPEEILSFCSTTQIHTSAGPRPALHILLCAWTELFEVIQGYKEIRLSVVALARVFEFGGDLSGLLVKGDVISESGRIVTRSQQRKSTTPIRLFTPLPGNRRFRLTRGY
jgi:hypothetical protein